MSEVEKGKLREKTYTTIDSYTKKDGTVVYTKRIRTYMASDKNKGRPKNTETMISLEVKKLCEKNKEKVQKYVEKLRMREMNEREAEREAEDT